MKGQSCRDSEFFSALCGRTIETMERIFSVVTFNVLPSAGAAPLSEAFFA